MQHPVVLFDGVCHFCNGTVNFLLKQNRESNLRFAPLQSAAGSELLQQHGLSKTEFASFVLVQNGKAYLRSSAALRLLAHLPWYWQWAQVFWIIPRPVRDGVYQWIARNRYRWFGKRETCMIPSAEVRERFL